MIYLTKEDIETEAITRLIDESTAYDDNVLNKIEKTVIGICKTFLTDYDVDTVFTEGSTVRDEVLVDIMSKILLYKVFSRNAARKVSEDIKENYKWAMKMLEKVQNGSLTLILPAVVLGEGKSRSVWGNSTNKDFYI